MRTPAPEVHRTLSTASGRRPDGSGAHGLFIPSHKSSRGVKLCYGHRYRGGGTMAVFVCTQCGAEREGRCKPQKCECGAKGSFVKKEEAKK